MIKASIIVPAHNVAPYIETCLLSALRQTLPDIEIIVVDDASTDDTPAIVERLAQAHANLRLIRFTENVGVSAARNTALDAARGEWIALLDSDDWMDSDRLAAMIAAAESIGVDWIADDQYFVFDGEAAPRARLIAHEPPGASEIDIVHVVRNDPPEHLGYGLLKPVFRRSFLQRSGVRYRPELRRYEDFLFLIELAAAGAKLGILNEARYWYRFRANSLTKWDPILIGKENLRVSQMGREVAQAKGMLDLDRALFERESHIWRGIRVYQVIKPIKSRQWPEAARSILSDPSMLPIIASRMTERFIMKVRQRDSFELLLLSHSHIAGS